MRIPLWFRNLWVSASATDVCIAAFTAVLAITSVFQLIIIRRQLNEMRASSLDSKRLADYAFKSQDAANRSALAADKFASAAAGMEVQMRESVVQLRATAVAQAAEEANASMTTKLSHRAWVGQTDISVSQPILGTRPDVLISFKNTGDTPAIYVLFGIAEFTANVPSSLIDDSQETEEISKLQDRAMGEIKFINKPDWEAQLSLGMHYFTAPYTEESLNAVKAPGHRTYYVSLLSHEDVFNERHLTAVCLYTYWDFDRLNWRLCNHDNYQR